MIIDSTWKEVLKDELKKSYFCDLLLFLKKEYANKTIYPPRALIFNALSKTPFDKVKVVIVGQDPYHGENQAHGLAFSVPKGQRPPPSLKNIFKELTSDLGIEAPEHGCLESWAEQGVLLLNTILTVQANRPASHAKRGWERFTDACLAQLYASKQPLIFVLWGRYAQEKCAEILQPKSNHTILRAPHPSPFSAARGFFGSSPFSKINKELTKQKREPIDWSVI